MLALIILEAHHTTHIEGTHLSLVGVNFDTKLRVLNQWLSKTL